MKSFILQNEKPVLSLKEYSDIFNGYFSYRNINNSLVSYLKEIPIFTKGIFRIPLYSLLTENTYNDNKENELILNAYSINYMSFKDRFIIKNNPHLVLDGALSFAKILKLKNIRIVLRNSYKEEYNILLNAIKETLQYSLDINIILDNETEITYRMLEEKYFLFDLETILQFIYICYTKEFEKPYEPSSIISVTGDINNAGIYEIYPGTSFHDIINTAGGIRRHAAVKCIFINGFLNPPLSEADAQKYKFDLQYFSDLNISYGDLCVIAEDTCIIRVMIKIVMFLEGVSCKECMPCMFGFRAIKNYLNNILMGSSSYNEYIEMINIMRMIYGGAICSYIRAFANTLIYTSDMFKTEILYAIENKTAMYSFYNEEQI